MTKHLSKWQITALADEQAQAWNKGSKKLWREAFSFYSDKYNRCKEQTVNPGWSHIIHWKFFQRVPLRQSRNELHLRGTSLSLLQSGLSPKASIGPLSPYIQNWAQSPIMQRDSSPGNTHTHTLLLQMPLSWVLLVPDDYAVDSPVRLDHLSLERNLNWLS